jgi:hypothetical protein
MSPSGESGESGQGGQCGVGPAEPEVTQGGWCSEPGKTGITADECSSCDFICLQNCTWQLDGCDNDCGENSNGEDADDEPSGDGDGDESTEGGGDDGGFWDDPSECLPISTPCGIMGPNDWWSVQDENYTAKLVCLLEHFRDAPGSEPAAFPYVIIGGDVDFEGYTVMSTEDRQVQQRDYSLTFGVDDVDLCTLKPVEWFQDCLANPHTSCAGDFYQGPCAVGPSTCPWD